MVPHVSSSSSSHPSLSSLRTQRRRPRRGIRPSLIVLKGFLLLLLLNICGLWYPPVTFCSGFSTTPYSTFLGKKGVCVSSSSFSVVAGTRTKQLLPTTRDYYLSPLQASSDDSERPEETQRTLEDNNNNNQKNNNNDNNDNNNNNNNNKALFEDILRQVFYINRLFWDYTVNFFYVAISCLILLNVCGYGYSFSMEDGFLVLPAQEYIQDRQWKEELHRRPATTRTTMTTTTTATKTMMTMTMTPTTIPTLASSKDDIMDNRMESPLPSTTSTISYQDS